MTWLGGGKRPAVIQPPSFAYPFGLNLMPGYRQNFITTGVGRFTITPLLFTAPGEPAGVAYFGHGQKMPPSLADIDGVLYPYPSSVLDYEFDIVLMDGYSWNGGFSLCSLPSSRDHTHIGMMSPSTDGIFYPTIWRLQPSEVILDTRDATESMPKALVAGYTPEVFDLITFYRMPTTTEQVTVLDIPIDMRDWPSGDFFDFDDMQRGPTSGTPYPEIGGRSTVYFNPGQGPLSTKPGLNFDAMCVSPTECLILKQLINPIRASLSDSVPVSIGAAGQAYANIIFREETTVYKVTRASDTDDWGNQTIVYNDTRDIVAASMLSEYQRTGAGSFSVSGLSIECSASAFFERNTSGEVSVVRILGGAGCLKDYAFSNNTYPLATIAVSLVSLTNERVQVLHYRNGSMSLSGSTFGDNFSESFVTYNNGLISFGIAGINIIHRNLNHFAVSMEYSDTINAGNMSYAIPLFRTYNLNNLSFVDYDQNWVNENSPILVDYLAAYSISEFSWGNNRSTVTAEGTRMGWDVTLSVFGPSSSVYFWGPSNKVGSL